MNNISQTKKDLKKKLSFNDYGISAHQQNAIPEDHNTSKPVEFNTVEGVQKQTDLPASNKENIPVNKQDDTTVQLQDVSTLNHNDTNKVKQYDSISIPVNLPNNLPVNLNTIDTITAHHSTTNMAKQNDCTSATVNQQNSLTASTMPSQNNDVTMVNQHNCVALHHQTRFTGKSVEHFKGIPVQHCHCNKIFQENPKIKATYYLSQEDNQALIDIYIKRLQSKNKTDKSALIAEAINLLYQKEMK